MRVIVSLLFIASLLACSSDTVEPLPLCEETPELVLVRSQASSCGLAIGQFEVNVTNSTQFEETFSFTLDGGTAQAEANFTNLAAGTYEVKAISGTCESSLNITIENEEGLKATATTTPSNCSTPSGQIIITATESTGTVTYTLDNGSPQPTPTFDNLAAGTYSINVSDDSGCTVELSITIVNDIEFSDVETIVNRSCAVSGCHAGAVSPDLRSKQNILDQANRIRSRTGSKTMPPRSSGFSLTDEQIEAIDCWVEDGAQG